MTDHVRHPGHYVAHPSGVECITVAQHFNFNRGNVIKYVWRADDKGNPLEDLRKARQYLDFEIARLEEVEASKAVVGDHIVTPERIGGFTLDWTRGEAVAADTDGRFDMAGQPVGEDT